MIVDAHAHVFPGWLRDQRDRYLRVDATFGTLYENPRARMATGDDLVRSMEEAGVDATVAAGIGWTDPGLAREVNDYVLAEAGRHGPRLVPFCSVNPRWPGAAAEVERCARAGARGVGELHPSSQGFDPAEEPALVEPMEVARAYGLPVLVHSSEPVGHAYAGKGTTTPSTLWALVGRFPANTIICAHWGGGLPFYALMPEVASALGNVYFDSAASRLLYRPLIFSIACRLLGAGSVLWATDYPLVRQSVALAEAREALPSAVERQRVLGGNAAALFGLP